MGFGEFIGDLFARKSKNVVRPNIAAIRRAGMGTTPPINESTVLPNQPLPNRNISQTFKEAEEKRRAIITEIQNGFQKEKKPVVWIRGTPENQIILDQAAQEFAKLNTEAPNISVTDTTPAIINPTEPSVPAAERFRRVTQASASRSLKQK